MTLHNLEGTLHLQTFLFSYTVSSSYLFFATYRLFSPCRGYAVKFRKSPAIHCLAIFVLGYFQQRLNNPTYEEKDRPIGLERGIRKEIQMKMKPDRTSLLKYTDTRFTASMRSPIAFNGTTYFLGDKNASKHLPG